MSNTATRLITLIMLLQRRPNQKAAELAEELGVSVRTVHRYINMLDEMGIPVYSERGPYGGFSLVRGYKMPPMVFTPQEAVAVYLGNSLVEEIWSRLYEEAARGGERRWSTRSAVDRSPWSGTSTRTRWSTAGAGRLRRAGVPGAGDLVRAAGAVAYALHAGGRNGGVRRARLLGHDGGRA